MTAGFTTHSGLRPEAKAYVRAGRGVVVDINGRGDFSALQDACDYWKGRNVGGRIWLRNGTYSGCQFHIAHLHLEGESWDAIIDGEATEHGVSVQASRCIIENLQAKTTGGGGSSFRPIHCDGSSSRLLQLYIPDSDDDGIYCGNTAILTQGCAIVSCDSDGIFMSSAASNCRVHNNYIAGNGGWGTSENAPAENCVYVGNRVTTNSSGQIQQNSGTGTYVGNDEA